MKYLLIILLGLGSLNLGAQNKNQERASTEKLEAQKIAFFTQKLDLSPEEAQFFWPIYNEYYKQKKELRSQRMPKVELEEVDDAEASRLIGEYFKNKEQSVALEKDYVEKFTQVLPPKKVLLLIVLEKKFKEEVLKNLKKRLDHKE